MRSAPKFYLTRRSNGFYYVGYFDGPHLRWKSTRARRKADALSILTDYEQLLASKISEVRFSAFEKEFLGYAEKSFALRTIIIYRSTFGLFRKVNGDPYLSQLTARHLDTYKTWRLGTVKPVTVNIEIRALRAALNSALRWKMLETNPFKDIRLIRVEETQPVFFSKADFQKLVNVMADEWLKEISLFAVLTGMRQAEITNLRWENVDIDNRLIHIQSGASFKTKQGKRRTIPMNSVVLAMLQKRVARDISEYVFSRRGNQIGESYLTHRFKHWVTEAELSEDLHFHSLRHTFASWLVQDGASLYEVQKLLGHSSSSMTEVYSHLQPEQMHTTVNRIDIAMN